MLDWQKLTPAEVMDRYPILTLEQVAFCLQEYHTYGQNVGGLNVDRVKQLIATHKLRQIDDDEPPRHWRVWSEELRSYMQPRKAAS